MNQTATHLRHIKNGRLFPWSERFAERSDMVPCNAQGELIEGHTGDVNRDVIQRPVTAFLGNPENGDLLNYSPILAERESLISVNSHEEWERIKKKGIIATKVLEKETPPAPTLEREPVPPAEPTVTAANVLPETDGLGAREAKRVLADWAKSHYGIEISRRDALPAVKAACAALIDSKQKPAVEFE